MGRAVLNMDTGKLHQRVDFNVQAESDDRSGSTTPYCGTGCQQGYGTCNRLASSSSSSRPASSSSSSSSSSSYKPASSTRISSAAPSSTQRVSTNARCGSLNGATGGYTCLGSAFGDCCSQFSYVRFS